MSYSFENFEAGVNNSFRFVSEKEALSEACKFIGAFANEYSESYEREIALYAAGRYAGALHDSGLFETLSSIFKRCAHLKLDETIELSEREKRFIKASIEGFLFKPFYE